MFIMVTGGNGFIGSNLTQGLDKKGIQNIVADLPHCDIRHPEEVNAFVKTHRPDVIINCAAVSKKGDCKRDPVLAVDVNTVGVFNLLEACRKYDIKRFIQLSTISVIDDVSSIYGATKLAAERLITDYDYAIDTTIIRTSSVYGEGDEQKRVITKFIERALDKKPLQIDRDFKTMFSYVGDVAEGIIQSIKDYDAMGKSINVVGDSYNTLEDVANIIKGFIPCEIVKQGGEPKKRKKVKPQYKPEVNLKEGIRRTIEWILDSTG